MPVSYNGRRGILGRVALGLCIMASFAGAGVVAVEAAAEPVPDVEIGLAKGSVFEVTAPPVPAVNDTDPGDSPLVGRAYAGAPPRVPHAVADFMPITRQDNWCVDCHAPDWTAPDASDPTPIPVSHYVNLRAESDDIGGTVVGARWVCVSCHVSKTEAPALVGNSFAD